jgi:predicted outer membrane repeat protein
MKMTTTRQFGFSFLIMSVCLFTVSPSTASTIYVDADNTGVHDGESWSTAFGKLQDALAVAASGDEIRTAQGTYRPDETSINPDGTGDRYAAFNLVEGIVLKGGYAGLGAADPNTRDISVYKTILSGDLDNNDTVVTNASQLLNDPTRSENCYHVVSITNGPTSLLLDGFTITGGIANGVDPHNTGGGIRLVSSASVISNCRLEYNAAANGGAIYNMTASNPVFNNCVFLRNYAQSTGGAIRNTTSSNPALSNCTFIENKAAGFGGAIGNYSNCSPTIFQCVFSYNWANNGGAINNYNFCSSQITESTFRYNSTDNTGGAIRNENHSDIQLISCGFYSNTAAHGAGIYNFQSNPVMFNCIASGNAAIEYGGVFYNRDATSINVTNCTLVNNTASIRGSAIYNIQSSPAIQNCILWDTLGSAAAPIYSESGSLSVTYSCIKGGWPSGAGNINSDPLFLDPNGADGITGTVDDDFRLFADSACIDSGNNLLVWADSTDVDHDADLLERIGLDFNGRERFVDDLNATDSGLSDPPIYPDIVDIGAIERRGPILVDSQAPGPEQDGTAWQTAYHHLQDALTACEKGDVIWVAQGIYRPDRSNANPAGSGNRNAAFALADGVILKGGYAGYTGASPNTRDIEAYPVILSGDLLGNDTSVTDPTQMQNDPNRTDNAYHVITANTIGVPAELNGFIIRGGHASGISGYPESFGGAMYNTNAVISMADCSFIGNWAITGGAIYNYSSLVSFSTCVFSQNAADDKGGVMRNTINSDSAFTDCEFVGNWAGSFGGVISNNDHSESMLTRCILDHNTASSAACVNNFIACNSTFMDCAFTSNAALSYGGAVNNYQQSNAQFIRCDFEANTAATGGAMYNDGSNPTLIDCSFLDNTASSNGGAIYCTSSFLTVEMSRFLGNRSGVNGGALCMMTADMLNLTGCVISSNTAAYDGGGLYLGAVAQANLFNCLITHNDADYGGGIANSGSNTVHLVHCTLSQNTAGIGSGIYNTSTANAVIHNSIVLDTLPADSVTVDYSCAPNWTGPGTGNITQNPLFADPDGPDEAPATLDDNYRLTSNSPCLDKADNAVIPAGLETDLDGLFRIMDANCSGTPIADMGAYEFSYLPMGDFDLNCVVDLPDFVDMAGTWLLGQGDPGYVSKCDISVPRDHVIDWHDLVILCENWLLGK